MTSSILMVAFLSIHPDVSVVCGINAHVGNARSWGERFTAAASTINQSATVRFVPVSHRMRRWRFGCAYIKL